MNKTFKLYLIILVVVIGIMAILNLNKTKVINWSKNYDINEKTPFGLYILNQEIDKLFNDKLERTTLSPYDYFEKDTYQGKQNLILIQKYFTNEGVEKILDRVAKGDNAFIVEEGLDYRISDTLKLIDYYSYRGKNMLELSDKKFMEDSVYIGKLSNGNSIGKIDTATTRILGSGWDKDQNMVANFVEVKFGKGKFYIHTEPLFLTNYYLLNKNDYKYAEDVFSYLPNQKTIWFQDDEPEGESASPMRFILEKPALRYAWYIFLFGMLFFVIFHAKRKQRVVPVIEPLKNSSAEFVKTIGNLYLQEGDNKDMAYKKATYFLNKVRTDLLIDTHSLDDVFVHRLQLKSGVRKDKIEEVIPLLKKALHEQAPIQEEDLIKMNKLLDEIYRG